MESYGIWVWFRWSFFLKSWRLSNDKACYFDRLGFWQIWPRPFAEEHGKHLHAGKRPCVPAPKPENMWHSTNQLNPMAPPGKSLQHNGPQHWAASWNWNVADWPSVIVPPAFTSTQAYHGLSTSHQHQAVKKTSYMLYNMCLGHNRESGKVPRYKHLRPDETCAEQATCKRILLRASHVSWFWV